MYSRAIVSAGRRILGRFELRERIGAGGLGVVYAARDHVTGQDVALKILRGGDELEPARFAREAQVLSGLDHPGIVRYVAHGMTPEGEPFLAMEWLDGETLSQRLKRQPLSLAEALLVVRNLADALSALHARGLVHRDVKPGNVILLRGDPSRVKLLDFGLARSVRQTQAITGTGAMLGTPSFMAPEQAKSAGDIGPRADLFALGAILFTAVAGRPPFVGDDAVAVVLKLLLEDAPKLAELVPEVPPEVDGLVQHLLAKSPENRPESAAVVVREIDLLLPVLMEGSPVSERLAFAEGLTTTERRLMCLVLARLSAFGDPEVTLAHSVLAAHTSVVHAVLARFDVRVEMVGHDLAIAVLTGTPEARDLAQRGARCALGLHGALPESHVVVVSGGEVVGKGVPTGNLVERGVRLLTLGEKSGRPSIWLDDATAGLLSTDLDVREAGFAHELTGERDVAAGVRTLLGKAVPCFGRERDLATLLGLYEECASEPVARAVLVTGAVGVGKSRLRYELVRLLSVRDRPPERWVARGDLLGAGSAFGMLGQLVRRTAGIHEGDPPEAQRERLSERVAAHVPAAEAGRVAAFLGEIAGIAFDAAPGGELAAARDNALLMHDQTLRAWLDFVRSECEARELVIVLEDLQWGDLPTIKYLDSALDALADKPLFVLALARPEVHETFPRFFKDRGLYELKLLELTRRASERLVQAALGESASAEAVQQIVERAQGNAFYLEELTRAVAERGQGHLPETVLATVQARLEALEPEARQLMRAASVFGQVFWQGGVKALVGSANAERLAEWMRILSERELFSPRADSRFPAERELVFRHALVREGAYASLTDRDRETGHRLAAAWLEAAGESDALVLAEHFERGADPASAARAWQRAAFAALQADDLEAALKRAARGKEANARGDADRELAAELAWIEAAAHQWRGENAAAERVGLEGLGVLERGSLLYFRTAREVIAAAGRLGNFERLATLSEELLGMEPEESAERAHRMALAQAAIQSANAGRLQLAERILARFSDSPEIAASDPLLAAVIDRARATFAGHTGDLGECWLRTQATVERLDAIGDVRTACLQRVNLGYAASLLGRFEESESHLRRALATADELRLHNASAMAKNNLGFSLLRLGRIGEALALESEAAEAFAKYSDMRMEAASRSYLALILLAGGDLGAARREAERSAAGSTNLPRVRAYALAVAAEVALAAGDAPGALGRAREAMDLFASFGVEEGEVMLRLAWVDALRASGEPARAAAALAEIHARIAELAAKIRDPELRRSFLEDVPEHARALALSLPAV